MPINSTYKFDVKCSSCLRENFLRTHNLAAQVEPNQMKDCFTKINADRV